MKVAILCICTGKYAIFWEEFFISFETYFLPTATKEYFVFSDAEELVGVDTGRVHIKHMEWQPWPIPTLMKFHTFLSVKDELVDFDYIYQPNSNARCRRLITEEMFLPRKEMGEQLMFTEHPAKWHVKGYKYPYERNPESMAYVPYNRSAVGVFGAMNGGEAVAYIEFMEQMTRRTEKDLKQCIIPIHHDESYVNNYIVRHMEAGNIRFLPSDYAYPQEYNIPCQRVIELEDKNVYFDTVVMKTIQVSKGKRTLMQKVLGRMRTYNKKLRVWCRQVSDTILVREAN